jgi:hypothetical protein
MEESPVITIQCDGGDVEAKKSLLVAVSDVFKAMLESDMIEKRTNIVLANDVNFETIKTIIDFYKEGTVSGFETMNRDTFTYIVEKYNFLGIKEEIAEYLLQKYIMTQDIKFLDSIFFTYGDRLKKNAVIKEMALMMAEGKEAPQFVTNFNATDFMELARCSCNALKGSSFGKFQGFLKTLYRWLSKDSENRSVVVLEIIGIIDMQRFSRQDVENILGNLTLSQNFQGFKILLQKSLQHIDVLENISKIYGTNDHSGCETSIRCVKCKHDDSYPYHVNPDCCGVHRCSNALDGGFDEHRAKSNACNCYISHPDKRIF